MCRIKVHHGSLAWAILRQYSFVEEKHPLGTKANRAIPTCPILYSGKTPLGIHKATRDKRSGATGGECLSAWPETTGGDKHSWSEGEEETQGVMQES